MQFFVNIQKSMQKSVRTQSLRVARGAPRTAHAIRITQMHLMHFFIHFHVYFKKFYLQKIFCFRTMGTLGYDATRSGLTRVYLSRAVPKELKSIAIITNTFKFYIHTYIRTMHFVKFHYTITHLIIFIELYSCTFLDVCVRLYLI